MPKRCLAISKIVKNTRYCPNNELISKILLLQNAIEDVVMFLKYTSVKLEKEAAIRSPHYPSCITVALNCVLHTTPVLVLGIVPVLHIL